MKNKNQSAYQKMYLVTPSVYEKLKSCIEEKEKLATDQLNFPKDAHEIKTPSEKIIQQISSKDMGIQTDAPEMTDMGVQTINPQTGEMGVQTVNPETGEIGIQVNPGMATIATETDTTPTQPIYTQTEQPNIPISTQTDFPEQIIQPQFQPEVYANPLREPCPQDTDQGRIIPSLLSKPRVSRISGGITKPQLRSALRQLPQNLLPKAVTFQNPLPIEYFPETAVDNTPPRNITSLQQTKRSNFPCAICGHSFTRKHDLKRHLQSRTVHQSVKKLTYQERLRKLIRLPPPGTPILMQEEIPPEPFDYWGDEPQPLVGNKPKLYVPQITKPKPKPTLIIPSILRQNPMMDITTPRVIGGKRSASKAKLGNIRIPAKLRPPGGEAKSSKEFDQWKG